MLCEPGVGVDRGAADSAQATSPGAERAPVSPGSRQATPAAYAGWDTGSPTSAQLEEIDLQGVDWEPMHAGPGYASNCPGQNARAGLAPEPQGSSPRRTALVRTLKLFLAGQLLSSLLTSTGVSNHALVNNGFKAPMLQSCLCFAAIAAVWIPVAAYTGKLAEAAKGSGLLKFALLGALEAEATFAAVTAYRSTSLVSVQLLDNLTVPLVMLLSYVLLQVRYRAGHFAGAGVCIAGAVLLVASDRSRTPGDAASVSPVVGDLWMVLAACLYAASNVAQEVLLKDRGVSPAEWLAGVGTFAAAVAGLQSLALERSQIRETAWGPEVTVLLAGVVGSQLAFYSLTPFFIRQTSAAFFNLSLLTADCYAALAGWILFSVPFSALYTISLALIVAGVIVFSLSPEPRKPRPSTEPLASQACHQKGSSLLELVCPQAYGWTQVQTSLPPALDE